MREKDSRFNRWTDVNIRRIRFTITSATKEASGAKRRIHSASVPPYQTAASRRGGRIDSDIRAVEDR